MDIAPSRLADDDLEHGVGHGYTDFTLVAEARRGVGKDKPIAFIC